MSYNLIWLIDPDDQNYCWERDWIHEILSLVQYREIFDYNIILQNAIIVINRSVQNLNLYFEKYEKKELDYIVIHLGDEAYTDDKEFYKNEHCKYILRNYFTLKYVKNEKILFFPLGYKVGFWNDKQEFINYDIFHRKYLWTFCGQLKSNRYIMINTLKKMTEYRCALYSDNSEWDKIKPLSITKYRDILSNSIFAMCPQGGCNIDTYRLQEALECGCIPIVPISTKYQPYDYYDKLFNMKTPFIKIDDWNNINDLIKKYLKDTINLEKYRKELGEWWFQYKLNLKVLLQKKLKEVFYKFKISRLLKKKQKTAVIIYHKNIDMIYPKSWVTKCLNSIYTQTYQNYDILEINYGKSSDSIIKNRIHRKYFWKIPMKNHIHAMNFLLDKAFNELNYNIVFNINLDDYYDKKRFSYQVDAINQGYDLISSNFYIFTENTEEKLMNDVECTISFINSGSTNSQNNIKWMLNNNKNVIAHPCVAYSRKFWKILKKYEDVLLYEDKILWKKAINEHNVHFKILKQYLLYYRIHLNQVSGKSEKEYRKFTYF